MRRFGAPVASQPWVLLADPEQEHSGVRSGEPSRASAGCEYGLALLCRQRLDGLADGHA